MTVAGISVRRSARGPGRSRRGIVALAAAAIFLPAAASADDPALNRQFAGSAGVFGYAVSIASPLAPTDVPASRIEFPAASVTLSMLPAVGAQSIQFNLRLVGIVFSDVHDGRAGAMNVDLLSLRTPWGPLKIGNIAARDVDVSALLSALDGRGFFGEPAKAGLSLSNLSFNLHLPNAPAYRMELLDLSAAFGQSPAGFVNALDIEGYGISFDPPSDLQKLLPAALVSLDLPDLSGTFRVAVEWNEQQETIDVTEISVTGRQLGGAFLTGEIAGASKALFTASPDEAQAAAAGLAMRFLTLSILDSGLRELAVAHLAKSSGGDLGAARAALARKVEGAIVNSIGSSDDAGAVAATAGRFLSGDSSGLDITAQAKSAVGIELPDFGGNIPALLRRVRIDAEAR